MIENRKLVVFGASGGTGAHLLPLLLEAGFRVRAVARDPDSIRAIDGRLEVMRGDVMNAESTARAIVGADGVISLVGPRRIGPTRVYSEGGRNIVAGMRAAGVRRLVAVTALGTSKDFRMPAVLGFFAKKVAGWVLRHNWRDGAKLEAELRSTDLDWTVVRPPALNDKRPRGRYRRGLGEHLWSPFRISRADLARAVRDQLDDPAAIRTWMEVSW